MPKRIHNFQNLYSQPLTKREEIAKTASLGPVRKHDIDSIKRPNYLARRAAALLLAAGSLVAGGKVINAINSDSSEKSPTPITSEIVVPGDTLWGLQKEELIKSGWDPDEVDMRNVVSDVIKMNGDAHIEPGDNVLIFDFKDRPGSPEVSVNKNNSSNTP
jgi:hypothetical protein